MLSNVGFPAGACTITFESVASTPAASSLTVSVKFTACELPDVSIVVGESPKLLSTGGSPSQPLA